MTACAAATGLDVELEELRFRAMGTEAHILVHGPAARNLARGARRRIDALESCWSRFRADSELSRLNGAAGVPCLVSRDLLVLVEFLHRAWERTGGRFDPTVGTALAELGYRQSWPNVTAPDALPDRRRAPGMAELRIDAALGLVWSAPGTQLDPGGLGKGLAADLVAGELMDQGAHGVLVNVGGDIRVMGDAPDGSEWRIAVEDPHGGPAPVCRVRLTAGAVVTTSRLRRAWDIGSERVHHVLDPETSLPAEAPWETVTVVAGTGWWAEAAAKAAFLDGRLPADGPPAAALFTYSDGTVRTDGDPDEQWFPIASEARR